MKIDKSQEVFQIAHDNIHILNYINYCQVPFILDIIPKTRNLESF